MRYFIAFSLLSSALFFARDASASTTARELQTFCGKATVMLTNGPEGISSYEDMFQAGRCLGIVEATVFQFLIDWKEAGCETSQMNPMQGIYAFLQHMESGAGKPQNPAPQEVWMGLSSAIPCNQTED